MKLKKIHTDKNPSDMLTKIVPKDKLELCRWLVGLDTKWWLEDQCASLHGLEGEIVGGGPVMGPVQVRQKKKKKRQRGKVRREEKKKKRVFSLPCARQRKGEERERERSRRRER
jgi:hypothetical protein